VPSSATTVTARPLPRRRRCGCRQPAERGLALPAGLEQLDGAGDHRRCPGHRRCRRCGSPHGELGTRLTDRLGGDDAPPRRSRWSCWWPATGRSSPPRCRCQVVGERRQHADPVTWGRRAQLDLLVDGQPRAAPCRRRA
jgi:hypothetical protein